MDDLIVRAQAVKARWSMESLITALTGDIVPANRKIISIFNPDEAHASMHIYDDHFHDFSTGKSGDVIELMRLVKHYSFENAIEALEEEADSLKLPTVERIVLEKTPFKMPKLDYDTPIPTPIDGVSRHTWAWLWADKQLAYRGHDIAVVHKDWYDSTWAIGVKYRCADGGKISEPGSEFTKCLYWVDKELDATQCVIMEGESDLWAWDSATMYNFGQPQLFALPAGAATWKDEWLKILEPYESVWICMDNDDAGKRARDKIALKVGYGRAEFVNLPKHYNDVREAVTAGWKPPKIG